MKNPIDYYMKLFCKHFILICLGGVFFLTSNNVVNAAANLTDLNFPKTGIVEHIRLAVPEAKKKAWLKAEKISWEPWLAKQDGFLGRQMFWDPSTQEAVLLIKWESKEKWKLISQSEINKTQQLFVKASQEETNFKRENPFPLVFEGELLPQ